MAEQAGLDVQDEVTMEKTVDDLHTSYAQALNELALLKLSKASHPS
jgi:hypothetical protein